jgi:hypothetical protein
MSPRKPVVTAARLDAGLSLFQTQNAFVTLEDARHGFATIEPKIEALCMSVLALLPDDSASQQLPAELRRKLSAARVLLELELPNQLDLLSGWVGYELERLADELRGGAA